MRRRPFQYLPGGLEQAFRRLKFGAAALDQERHFNPYVVLQQLSQLIMSNDGAAARSTAQTTYAARALAGVSVYRRRWLRRTIFDGNRSVGRLPQESCTVTPAQLREARRLLGWTIEQVAVASGAYYHVIYSYENSGGGTTRRLLSSSRVTQMPIIQAALEAAGVKFTDEDAAGAILRPTTPV